MEAGEAGKGQPPPRGGDVVQKWLDARPVKEREGPVASCQPGCQALKHGSGAGIDAKHAQLPVALTQLDIPHLNEAGGFEVDYVVVQNVRSKQDLEGPALKRAEIEAVYRQPNIPGGDTCRLTHGNEDVSPPDSHHETGDGGTPALPKACNQVANPSQSLAGLPQDRASHDLR